MMDAFEIVKAARSVSRSANTEPHEPSSATKEEYKRVFKRLTQEANFQVEEVIRRAACTTHRNTWFKHSAALRYVALSTIQKQLSEQDNIQRILRTNPDDSDARSSWMGLLRELDFYTTLFNTIPNGCPIPEAERSAPHSKKKDLKGLPEDWQERLLLRMEKYYTHLLVTACTGCRPAELVAGVTLQMTQEGLVATIQGKKRKNTTSGAVYQGQEWRKLTWNKPKDGLMGLLTDLVIEFGGTLVIRFDEETGPSNFSTAVRDAARREWPGRKTTVTPYCFRHAFSAALKAAKLPRKVIAAAMGHASDATCQYYGSANQARRSSVVPDIIESAQEVREKYIHNPPPPRNKRLP